MARGRRPEPAAIKRAKGNPGRRPVADAPEAAAAELTSAPAWLDTSDVKTAAARRLSAIAKAVWQRLHGELVSLKLLKATDEHAFARYCRYAAEWIEYTRQLDKVGAWYTTSSDHVEGIIRPHPAFRFRKDVEHAMKELEDRIGLTPAARQRIFAQLAERVPPQASLPGLQPGVQAPSSSGGAGSGDLPFGFLGSNAVN